MCFVMKLPPTYLKITYKKKYYLNFCQSFSSRIIVSTHRKSKTSTKYCMYSVPTKTTVFSYKQQSTKLTDIMSSNGAHNDQWLTAGTKKSDKAADGSKRNKDGVTGTYSTSGEHHQRELPVKQDNKDDNDVEMEEGSPKDRKADISNLVGQTD
jgi:hypothetical protein